jgi:aminopeptidase N
MSESVTTPDFQRAMERATGADLTGFFRQWVYSAGGGV